MRLVEYLPTGLKLSENDGNGWIQTSATLARLETDLFIPPGGIERVNLLLEVTTDAVATDSLISTTEIAYAEDEQGIDRSDQDFDSFLDIDPVNDGVVIDNEIIGNPVTSIPNADEDDHDVARIKVEIFDLALKKTYDQGAPVFNTSLLEFDLTVYNQGTIAVDSIELIDYLPLGTQLSADDTDGWQQVGNTSTLTLDQRLTPGDSIELNIQIELIGVDTLVQLTNRAEILSAQPVLGLAGPAAIFARDFDGEFDDNPDDDLVVNDALTDTLDSDDHDIAVFVICITEVRNTNENGLFSLRFALECANLRPGPDTISFNLPGVASLCIYPALISLPTVI